MNSYSAHGTGAVAQPATQEEITATPLWHLYDYDLGQKTYTLMRIEETLYREASFLDARIQEFNCPAVRYEMQHLAQMFPRPGRNRGPMGFIFHVGHCGSTLISRALSSSARFLPFREPLTLRLLSAEQRELGTPAAMMARDNWRRLLITVLDSLARRFRPDQVNIVKATSTGNNLIRPIMEEDSSHRALLLFVPLETYLANMLGKQKDGGDLWKQARTRMRDWTTIAAEPEFSLHELGRPQLAALSWITSINYMFEAHAALGDRTRMFDFNRLVSDPADQLPAIAGFFGLEDEGPAVAGRFPEVSSGYSKRPEKRYTPETRAQLLRIAREEQADAIRTGLEWASGLIERHARLSPLGNFLE